MKTIKVKVAVIGSGCAGYNAADSLYDLGVKDVALFTEGINMGTSRNTGSDKQTYYKLGLSGAPDSVEELAQTLFNGEGVNGDTALCEAANSVRCFLKLTELGVPFPRNEYGEFPGYKTDHDPRERASSVGPLTSKIMVEKLEQSVKKKNIPIYDGYYVYKILVKDNKAYGMRAISKGNPVLILAEYVILATGGPAGIYQRSVYPESQTGSAGLAIDCGASLSNFAEWQYGLASIKFRWNVSGTYQQVLPRYVAIDKNGNEREFLPEYFETPQKALDNVFLKGYQWPFDSKKINGSSIIDLIIYHETVNKGNRVYMDFTREPQGLDFTLLNDVTVEYLKRSGATMELPINRLAHMNEKAIQIYKDHGIDLYKEYLEVAVCAQHHNGGMAVDKNWQTDIENLYAVGECAGTFGVYRPGGSALNSTQVGSLRAAEDIAIKERKQAVSESEYSETDDELLGEVIYGKSSIWQEREYYQSQMSRCCAHIRSISEMQDLLEEFKERNKNFFKDNVISSEYELADLFRNRSILLSSIALLENAIFTAQYGSRGSAIVLSENGEKIIANFKYKKYDEGLKGKQVIYKGSKIDSIPVREIPKPDNWFENVWNEFNKKWQI